MSRSLSTAAKTSAFGPQDGEVFLALIQIDHASFSAPYRFARNLQDVLKDGDTYQAFPFDIDVPAEDAEELPTVTLSIDNVSRAITDALVSLTTAPTVTLWIVLASSPSTIEAGPFALSLRDISYDAFKVTGTLGYERMLEEQFPGDIFSPRLFPGLF